MVVRGCSKTSQSDYSGHYWRSF